MHRRLNVNEIETYICIPHGRPEMDRRDTEALMSRVLEEPMSKYGRKIKVDDDIYMIL